tara:strand:- start:2318 stop:2983 length:666 start_codon:yes stop_codon:yes gene_type:complete
MSEGFLEITTSDAEIKKIIMQQIADDLNSNFRAIAEDIDKNIKPIIYNAIHECYELQALRGPYLRGSLGLTSSQATSASQKIAQVVSDSVIVKTKTVTANNLSAGLQVFIQPEDYANVLSISGAVVSYRSRRFKRTIDLPWLDWLLTKGDQILVSGFEFEPGGNLGRSRTGRMVKAPAGSWRVSPEYSGTKGDNFITRAFDRRTQSQITKIVQKAVDKRLK